MRMQSGGLTCKVQSGEPFMGIEEAVDLQRLAEGALAGLTRNSRP